MPTKEDLLHCINGIKDQLKTLKLEVQELDEADGERLDSKKSFFKIGDRVKILNPRYGQEDQGVVCKSNAETGWVTVQTKKGKVRRQFFNVVPNREL